MRPAPLPADEAERIEALRALDILDTEAEDRFDRVTRIACQVFSAPIALVSLVDSNRQWFKSRVGVNACETSRDFSFCAHALFEDEVLHVEDALKDERFFDNPLVTGEPWIRFYAGCPLQVGNYKMGTLCVIDTKPRPFGEEEKRLLTDLAALVEHDLASECRASTDSLTKLANRRGFEAIGRQVLAICARLARPLTLLYFDLDGFKQINDRFGHAEGDRALKTFAGGLESVFRESDAVVRLGGDEFAVLLTDTSPDEAKYAASRLRSWVDEENRTANRGYAICFSAGEVGFDPARHQSVDDMLKEADASMYRDKECRRSYVR